MRLKDILKSYKESKEMGITNFGPFLMELIENGYTRSVKKMINDPTNDFGNSYDKAIEYAVLFEEEDIAMLLLDDYRFVNYESLNKSINRSVRERFYKFVKKALTLPDSDVSYQNYYAIQSAAYHKKKRIVKLFLKHPSMDYDHMVNSIFNKSDKDTKGFIKKCWSEVKAKDRDKKINNILK